LAWILRQRGYREVTVEREENFGEGDERQKQAVFIYRESEG